MCQSCREQEVAPSAITVMLDRLENQGFVTGSKDKTDRRVDIIKLTNTGEEKSDHFLAIRKKSCNIALKRWILMN
ncbi:MarR family transcriptional regulator [Ectobacillus funiculus]|uniref:MarR family transcriptional regulator n=1 Tax=Ectobacillus funiculus TaxID=137993 RepID=UPI003CCC49CA